MNLPSNEKAKKERAQRIIDSILWLLLLAGVLFLLGTIACVYWYSAATTEAPHPFADYVAYAAPAFAAIMAGVGVVTKPLIPARYGVERMAYLMSVGILVAGAFSYGVAHSPCSNSGIARAATPLTIGTFWISMAVFVIAMAVDVALIYKLKNGVAVRGRVLLYVTLTVLGVLAGIWLTHQPLARTCLNPVQAVGEQVNQKQKESLKHSPEANNGETTPSVENGLIMICVLCSHNPSP